MSEAEQKNLEFELLNGGGEDLRVQSRALAVIMRELRRQGEELAGLRARVDDMPARFAATVAVHAQTCAAAARGEGGALLEVGKGWLKAKGAGVRAAFFGAIVAAVLVWALRDYLAGLLAR